MAVTRSSPDNADLRRRHRRFSVLWTCRLGTGGERGDGAILNLSAGGAKLRVADPAACPAQLTIESKRLGRLDGRVVWRKDNLLGLAFLGAPKDIGATLDAALNPA